MFKKPILTTVIIGSSLLITMPAFSANQSSTKADGKEDNHVPKTKPEAPRKPQVKKAPSNHQTPRQETSSTTSSKQ